MLSRAQKNDIKYVTAAPVLYIIRPRLIMFVILEKLTFVVIVSPVSLQKLIIFPKRMTTSADSLLLGKFNEAFN